MAFVPPAVEGRPAKDSAGFHKRLALLLQVLLQLSGGNMVPGVSAPSVIDPGTHKEAFTAGCLVGPLQMPAPVGQLRCCTRCFPLACQQCQRIQGLLHLLYTVYNAPVCCGSVEKVQCISSLGKALMKGKGVCEFNQQETHLLGSAIKQHTHQEPA